MSVEGDGKAVVDGLVHEGTAGEMICTTGN